MDSFLGTLLGMAVRLFANAFRFFPHVLPRLWPVILWHITRLARTDQSRIYAANAIDQASDSVTELPANRITSDAAWIDRLTNRCAQAVAGLR